MKSLITDLARFLKYKFILTYFSKRPIIERVPFILNEIIYTWQNTNVLNINVLSTSVEFGPVSPNNFFPPKLSTARTASW